MRRKNSDLGWTYKIHTNLLTGQQEGFKFHREVFGSEVSENLPADRIVQKTDDDQNYSKNFSQSIATKFAIDKMFNHFENFKGIRNLDCLQSSQKNSDVVFLSVFFQEVK